jgi:hypothetical protein
MSADAADEHDHGAERAGHQYGGEHHALSLIDRLGERVEESLH